MIIPVQELLLTLPVLLLSACVFVAVGRGMDLILGPRTSREKIFAVNASGLFRYIFAGLWLVVSIYAIIVTRFQTCLLPVPILVFFLARSFLRHQVSADKKGYELKGKNLFIFILIALLVYWCSLTFCFISFHEQSVKFVSSDVNFYGRIAEHINQTGVENTSLEYLQLTTPVPEPYHYGDIWLIAFLQRITGLHPSVITTLCVYPLLALLFTCGIISCISYCSRQPLSRLQLAILMACIYMNGLVFLYPSFLFSSSTLFSVSLITYPKMLVPALFLTAFIQCVQAKAPAIMIILFTLAALLFTPIAPPLGIVCAIIIARWIIIHKYSAGKIYTSSFIAIACLIYLYLFYQKNTLGNYYNFSTPEMNARTIFNIIVGCILQLLPLLPFIFLYYYTVNNTTEPKIKAIKQRRQLVSLLLLFFIAALACYAILYSLTQESVQFFSNVILPAFSIFIALSLVTAIMSGKRILRVAALVLLGYSLVINATGTFWTAYVSREDLTATKRLLEKNEPGNFVILQSMKGSSINPEFSLSLPYIDYIVQPYITISLNTPDLAENRSGRYRNEERKIVEKTSYGQYVLQNTGKIPAAAMMHSFFQRYPVQYFCVSPDTSLPAGMRIFVMDSIRLDNRWNIYHLNIQPATLSK